MESKFQPLFFSEKMKRLLLICSCAVLALFISIMAFFTSSDKVTNRFVAGDIKIDLVEPMWSGNADPNKYKNNSNIDDSDPLNPVDHSYSDSNYILPGELIPKDPKIVNTGKNEAIVFLKVELPVYTDENGIEWELFCVSSHSAVDNASYNPNMNPVYNFSELAVGNHLGGDANKWIYMGTSEGEPHAYILGYTEMLYPESMSNNIADNRVKYTENEQTSPIPFQTQNLFNYVMLNPKLNGIDPDKGDKLYQLSYEDGTMTERKALTQSIRVFAYGIQAKNLGDDISEEDNFSYDELKKAWDYAGFGDLANSSVPNADVHNKYGIPQENYAGSNSDPWSNGVKP